MRRADWVATAILAALLGFSFTHRTARVDETRVARGTPVAPNAPRLVTPHGSLAIEPSRLVATFASDGLAIPMDLELVADGNVLPLSLSGIELMPDGSVRGAFHLDLDGHTASGSVAFHRDVSRPADHSGSVVAKLSIDDPLFTAAHAVSLAVEIEGECIARSGRPVFVSGVGEISDAARVSGRVAVLEDDAHPLGVASARGLLDVRRHPTHGPDDEHGDGPMDLILSSPPAREGSTELAIVLSAASASIWETLFAQAQLPTEHVHGVVTGTRGRAHVFGLDASGAPFVRAAVDPDGHFALDVPRSVNKWYAAERADRTSSPIVFEPGTPWDLRLDVSPGGELRVRIMDPDTHAPLTARLVVHGIDGTLDPSFGPDYRASGAGPIVDALRGEVATPLPAGRYLVSATKGIEYTVDAKTIEIAGDRTVSLELHLRHVVPTPGALGCDLHVHARPSFDTPVTVEDRVLSLVAAGVDFAVPSEHNVVGNYAPALETLDLEHDMTSVPGVEITTFNPHFGHFGLFPYPLDAKVPPFRHTTPSAIFDAARRGDPNRILQVNHPRLTKEIGYFDAMGLDAHGHGSGSGMKMRTDFDSIEIYNGYEMQSQERVDLVLRDYYGFLNQGRHITATGSSDSHSIQYQWAGYPRTLVSIGKAADGDIKAVDPLDVVANLKRGHAVVTSGPIVDVEARTQSGDAVAHPGDDLVLRSDGSVVAHIRVRAAPWVDVTSVEIVVDGATSSRIEVPSQPTKIGDELGTLEEAMTRALRFERDLQLPLSSESRLSTTNPDSRSNTNNMGSPSRANDPSLRAAADTRRHWFVVIVRGTRKIDDVLPFMPVAPMAITNPIWVQASTGSTIGADSVPVGTPGAKRLRGGPTQ